MLKNKYQLTWLKKLINKIINVNQPNNASFYYYNHLVLLQSNTNDFVVVTIFQNKNNNSNIIANFSIDFNINKLILLSYANERIRQTIVNTLKQCALFTIIDEFIKTELNQINVILNNKNQYKENYINKINKHYHHIINLINTDNQSCTFCWNTKLI